MIALTDKQFETVMTAASPLAPEKRSILLERVASHLCLYGRRRSRRFDDADVEIAVAAASWAPFVDEHDKAVEDYNAIVRDYNKLAGEYNAVVRAGLEDGMTMPASACRRCAPCSARSTAPTAPTAAYPSTARSRSTASRPPHRSPASAAAMRCRDGSTSTTRRPPSYSRRPRASDAANDSNLGPTRPPGKQLRLEARIVTPAFFMPRAGPGGAAGCAGRAPRWGDA
jgi:hypothetical protein